MQLSAKVGVMEQLNDNACDLSEAAVSPVRG